MIKDYCTQNSEDCSSCSLSNYGRDCQNIPIGRGGKRDGAGRPKQGDEVFYKRCTLEQKQKLEEYWIKLRAE